MTFADGAVIAAVAFPAPRLEPGPDVITGGIGRRPVLGGPAAINAGVIAGRPPGFLNPVVQHVSGRVSRLPGGPGQLVPARPRAGPAITPDRGQNPAGR